MNGAPSWMQDIINEVSVSRGIPEHIMFSTSRTHANVRARWECWARIYTSASPAWKSYNRIAKLFGFDHVTVMHGINRHLGRPCRVVTPEGLALRRARARREQDRRLTEK